VAALGERIGATSIVLLEATSSGFRADSISIPARGFLPGRLRHFTRAVAISGADLEAWRRWARAYRPEHADELEALSARGVRLAAALRAKHEIVGILLLGGPIGGDAYTPAERQIVAGSADIIALLIENARLTEREIAQETLRRDLQLAGEVQRRLLPPQPPGSRAGTLAAFSMPARTVGGDYYDFVDLGGDRVGIAIADVSGKGIAAALLMSVVQASLRVISTEQAPSPAPLAAKMNAFLHQSTGANKYATFFYAEVEAAGRHLRYVNAGHNPPLLARRTDGALPGRRPGGVHRWRPRGTERARRGVRRGSREGAPPRGRRRQRRGRLGGVCARDEGLDRRRRAVRRSDRRRDGGERRIRRDSERQFMNPRVA
jgi:hypothetical protein